MLDSSAAGRPLCTGVTRTVPTYCLGLIMSSVVLHTSCSSTVSSLEKDDSFMDCI